MRTDTPVRLIPRNYYGFLVIPRYL